MVAQNFVNYLLTTGEHWFSGPERRINDSVPRNFATNQWVHRKNASAAIVKKAGGTRIVDETMLSFTPRMAWTDVTNFVDPTMTETGIKHSIPWRLAISSVAYNEWVEEHNADARVTADGGAQRMKDYARKKFQEMYSDAWVFQENSYWARPDFASMETAGEGVGPSYSWVAHNNEFANGLVPASTGSPAWTQFQSVASTATGFGNYIPRRDVYNNLTVNDPANLLNALDDQYEFLKIEPPPMHTEYFEPESEMNDPGCVTFTQVRGKNRLKQLCRASNDRWDNQVDAYFGAPTFAGIPIVCPAPLETASIYPTGAAGVWGTYNSTANSNAGPRYHTFNMKYMKVVYDRDWYWRAIPLGREWGRGTVQAVEYYLGYNSFNLSPRRHGTVYPGANIP